MFLNLNRMEKTECVLRVKETDLISRQNLFDGRHLYELYKILTGLMMDIL